MKRISLKDLENKRILLLGYGVEGKATEKFLKKYIPSATIKFTDKESLEEIKKRQKEFDIIVRSPGIKKSLVKNDNYTTATNIFFSLTKGKHKTIGVTGTKGKSTTASLISHILSGSGIKNSLAGNIGVPLLQSYMENTDPENVFVCELSSYQLDDIEYSPNISVVTSLFPDHLDYHDSLKNYYQAKKNILFSADEKDIYIYNSNFETLKNWTKEFRGKSIPHRKDFSIKIEQTKLIGEHNLDNIKIAMTVCGLFGFKEKDMKNSIKTFKPLEHRLELVGEFDGIKFYNDSISTTPESTIAGINSLKDIGTIFLGGQDRCYDFKKLAEVIYKKGIKNLVLFPETGERIAKEIKKIINYKPKILKTRSMEEAVLFSYQNTEKGKICLLSTASPSYTLWKNFKEKGLKFKEYVKKYAKNKEKKGQDK